MVLMIFFSESLYIKGIERILGSIVSFIIMFFIFKLFSHSPVIVLISCALILFYTLYLFYKDIFSYGIFFIAFITSIMGCVYFIHNEEAAIAIGYYWNMNVIIGVISSLAVYELFRLIHPQPEKHLTKRKDQLQIPKYDLNTFKKFELYFFLKAIFMVLSISLVLYINYLLSWKDLSLQALIAIFVVMLQRLHRVSIQKALHRMRGVFLGAITAFAVFETYRIFNITPLNVVNYIVVSVILGIYIFYGTKYRKKEYIFMQASILLCLILLPEHYSHDFNTYFARERGFGSLEGAFIGLILNLLFKIIINVLRVNPPDDIKQGLPK
ncbi:MAG: FUSC family protein [Bacteroidales bacterium]